MKYSVKLYSIKLNNICLLLLHLYIFNNSWILFTNEGIVIYLLFVKNNTFREINATSVTFQDLNHVLRA